jgi:hypothetical protein
MLTSIDYDINRFAESVIEHGAVDLRVCRVGVIDLATSFLPILSAIMLVNFCIISDTLCPMDCAATTRFQRSQILIEPFG